jgi:hypothetical protein
MTHVGGATEPVEGQVDPAYPVTTPPDPIYPCQTRAPLRPPLDGVAVPAIWSRIQRPLERSLERLWDDRGLSRRARPAQIVAVHYGRIAVNAHAWERLRAHCAGESPDPALVGPPAPALRALEIFERVRMRWRAGRIEARVREASGVSERLLRDAAERNPQDLSTAEVARGPLDARAWTEILTPFLGLPLTGEDDGGAPRAVRAGIALEERFAAEAGRRLVGQGVLNESSDIAYLTVEERLRAVHEASSFWDKLVRERRGLVDDFVELDVPIQFWGRPRVNTEKTG